MHGKWHDDFDVVPPRREFQFSLYEEVLEEEFQRGEFMEGTKRMFRVSLMKLNNRLFVKRTYRISSMEFNNNNDLTNFRHKKNCINSNVQLVRL